MTDNAELRDLWNTHNGLRDKHHALESRVVAAEQRAIALASKMEESRRERNLQYLDLKKDLAAISTEVAEARGAARFGKWVIAILLALGVPPALFAWYSGGGR